MSFRNKEHIKFAELVTLMALYVAMMAMAIDTILPALGLIGKEFGIVDENKTQYIIGLIFLGFALGQIIYGPIADSFGRKNTAYLGFVILVIGNIFSLTAKDFSMMLLGRFLQGFGAASPRIVSIAIIRDLYKGSEMARVMSFIMTVFIIIPVIAPSIGQALLLVVSWRVIFYIFLVAAMLTALWTYLRLPETLKKHDVRPFNLRIILKDFRTVLTNKITVGYTICTGLVFAGLIGYLTSSRQIFQDYFAVGESFSLYFGVSALAIGISSIVNSMIVRRLGMKLICNYAIIVVIIMSAIFLPFSLNEKMPIWIFMIYISATFFCMGLLFGNLNALAMEPMGHYAGIASAVCGSLSSIISTLVGTFIGQSYNGSLTPIFIGFLFLSMASFVVFSYLKNLGE